MSWARVDDRFWCHPKLDTLDDMGPRVAMDACGLWVRALSYASGQDASGTITATVLRKIMPPNMRPKRGVDALVKAGLWDEVRPGEEWRIHDFEQYRPPAERSPARRNGGETAEIRPRNGHSPTELSAAVETTIDPVEKRRRSGRETAEIRSRNGHVGHAESLEKVPTPEPVPEPVPDPNVSIVSETEGASGPMELHARWLSLREEKCPNVAIPSKLKNDQWHPRWQKLQVLIRGQAKAEGVPARQVEDRLFEQYALCDFAATTVYKPGQLEGGFEGYMAEGQRVELKARDKRAEEWRQKQKEERAVMDATPPPAEVRAFLRGVAEPKAVKPDLTGAKRQATWQEIERQRRELEKGQAS